MLYVSEQTPRDYYQLVAALPARLQEKPIDDPEVLTMLRERGVAYIYIGQRQGRVNYAGPAVISPEQLRDSPHFRPVYHEDRVGVRAAERCVNRPASQASPKLGYGISFACSLAQVKSA